jgi:hypothetical protein
MLTRDFPFLLPRNVGDSLPATLHSLADDLERIRAGTGPTRQELARAPLIVGWRCVLTPVGLRLDGLVTGHPIRRDGPALTSQLWAADSGNTWIRTMSRFYRLGWETRERPTAVPDRPCGADRLEGDL